MAKTTKFSASADAAFFGSYDGVPVHEKMIKDDVRTSSYLNAIENNPHLFRDKVVLDIGTGTGILSMFCVRAGAKHVYATDVSSMIHIARRIAEVNGMAEKITFVQGPVEDADLPQVDIIVSEWMGFCLLSEIMLDCLLQARDKYLAPGGLMFPDRTSLYLAGIEDAQRVQDKVAYWDDIYGLDFSPLKPAAITKGFLRTPSANQVATEAACVLDLDLATVRRSDLVLDQLPFQLTAKRADTVHALLAWFDYDFTLGTRPIHVSTGPFHQPTHWKQTVFYLDHPLHVRAGDAVSGQASFEQSQRDLNVRISYEGPKRGPRFANGVANGTNGTGAVNETPATCGSVLYKVDAVE